MKHMVLASVFVVLLAGCNNDDDRIEELEGKIEQLESQRAANGPGSGPSVAPGAPTPGASPGVVRIDGPAGPPAPSGTSTPTGNDGNVCNDGRDRHLILVNRNDQSMMYFYASPPAAGDWEEDVLGSDVVSKDERFRINFNTDPRCTCTYDTRAVFADDSEVVRKVSVCTDHMQTYP